MMCHSKVCQQREAFVCVCVTVHACVHASVCVCVYVYEVIERSVRVVMDEERVKERQGMK